MRCLQSYNSNETNPSLSVTLQRKCFCFRLHICHSKAVSRAQGGGLITPGPALATRPSLAQGVSRLQ